MSLLFVVVVLFISCFSFLGFYEAQTRIAAAETMQWRGGNELHYVPALSR